MGSWTQPLRSSRVVLVFAAYYVGALAGMAVFHVVTARALFGPGIQDVSRILASIGAPLFALPIICTQLGPALAELTTVVMAIVLRRKAFPLVLITIAIGTAIAMYWTSMLWKTG